MIYGSVCSGIGAPELAWSRLGWRCAFMSEIAPAPRAVLQHHYPDVPLHGDFISIEANQYEAIDLLVGGTPCQSFSVAGFRSGLADERGNLALEYLRLAERLRPRWIVWENVAGVRSSNEGRDFGTFLTALGELGYWWAYRSVDAQFAGLAQRRERVFVVGYLGGWHRPAAVLSHAEGLCWHPAPRRQTQQRTSSTVEARLGAYGGNNTSGAIDVSTALNASHTASGRQDFESETFVVAHTLRAEGFDASEDGTGRGTPIVAMEDGVRRLTVTECCRLMGFPDDFFDDVIYRKKALADGPRLQMLGNSIAVPVIARIGRRIELMERGT